MLHLRIFESRQFTQLSLGARITYIGTIALGDDAGRLKADPVLIRSRLWARDEDVTVAQVDEWMKEIYKTGKDDTPALLISYQSSGDLYAHHPRWTEFQSLRNDRYKPEHPAPPEGLGKGEETTDNQPTTNGKPTGTKCPRNITELNLTKHNKTQPPDSAEPGSEKEKEDDEDEDGKQFILAGLARGLMHGLMSVNPSFEKTATAGKTRSQEINTKHQKKEERWAVDLRRLIEIDGKTPAQIHFVICWLFRQDVGKFKFSETQSEKAEFWQTVIMSGDKLRKQFDRIVGIIKNETGKTVNNSLTL